MQTRKATQLDRNYREKLEALKVEQAGLNRRIKAQRERAQAITVEFFAIKTEWANATASEFTLIDWS